MVADIVAVDPADALMWSHSTTGSSKLKWIRACRESTKLESRGIRHEIRWWSVRDKQDEEFGGGAVEVVALRRRRRRRLRTRPTKPD